MTLGNPVADAVALTLLSCFVGHAGLLWIIAKMRKGLAVPKEPAPEPRDAFWTDPEPGVIELKGADGHARWVVHCLPNDEAEIRRAFAAHGFPLECDHD